MIFYLVRVDTAGKQNYIFGSNRLRENIGASHLIASVTGTWAFEAVSQIPHIQHNLIQGKDQFIINQSRPLKSGRRAAEIIYSGGGSFLVLFSHKDDAKTFNRALSRKVLENAPGLQLLISPPIEVDWEKNNLKEKMRESTWAIDGKWRGKFSSRPLAGLGVTMMCSSTGLPAVGLTDTIKETPGYAASAEVLAKWDAKKDAKARLYATVVSEDVQIWGEAREERYQFPDDFDEVLENREDFNYVAVVHADGDGLGAQLQQLGDETITSGDYLNMAREFSDSVNDYSQTALREIVESLVRIKTGGTLPIRPLVFGGDDVTFVCDGKYGLSLAIAYLRAFYEASGKNMTACAGIAIVKAHYPFSRAYDLAEDLCSSAKKFKRDNGITGCCLDWHFAQGGLSGNIEFIREREYNVPAHGSLTLRPVALDIDEYVPDARTWQTIENGIGEFNKTWRDRRNKVKALQDALRAGPQAVKQFRQQYSENNELLPPIASDSWNAEWQESGWRNRSCGYFDAIELMDWHVSLQ